MTRNDFTVGQTVYLKSISHPFDCWKKECIVEGTVTKVGKKYIHVRVNKYREYRFSIENDFRQETVYSPEYVLYLTKQRIFDYWQYAYLHVEIDRLIRSDRKLKLHALKEAAQALGIPLEYRRDADA